MKKKTGSTIFPNAKLEKTITALPPIQRSERPIVIDSVLSKELIDNSSFSLGDLVVNSSGATGIVIGFKTGVVGTPKNNELMLYIRIECEGGKIVDNLAWKLEIQK